MQFNDMQRRIHNYVSELLDCISETEEAQACVQIERYGEAGLRMGSLCTGAGMGDKIMKVRIIL